MQHRRHAKFAHKRLVISLALVAVLIGGLVALAMMDVPAPQNPVEKELDAKAFLSAKPQ